MKSNSRISKHITKKQARVNIDEIISNKEKEKTREKIRDWTLIAAFLSISLVIIVNTSTTSTSLRTSFNEILKLPPESVQLVVNFFNIGVSLIFLVLFSKLHHEISDSSVKVINRPKYKEITDFTDYLDLKIVENPERVRNLEKQFLLFMIFFSISLSLTYAIIIILKVFVVTQITIYTTVIEDTIYKEIERLPHLLVYLANVLNISGGLFVYLAFRVLHDKTLESNHRTWRIFWLRPVLAFFSYTILLLGVYFLFSTSLIFPNQVKPNFSPRETTIFLNVSDLFAGLIVGICMTLLFGRYVSIEQSVKNTKKFNVEQEIFLGKFSLKRFMSIVIILILPFYALSQLLFGSLTIEAFGDAIFLQNGVYISCLIGKSFFFWITYVLIKKNLLNLYMHGVVAQVGDYKTLEKCLDSDRTEVGKLPLQEIVFRHNDIRDMDEEGRNSWWEDRLGIFANDPAHEKAVNIGRNYRNSQKIKYEENNK